PMAAATVTWAEPAATAQTGAPMRTEFRAIIASPTHEQRRPVRGLHIAPASAGVRRAAGGAAAVGSSRRRRRAVALHVVRDGVGARALPGAGGGAAGADGR